MSPPLFSFGDIVGEDLPGQTFMMQMLWQFSYTLEQWSKRKVIAASGYAEKQAVSLKEMKPHGGQLFNQTTSTGWKSKNGQLFHIT